MKQPGQIGVLRFLEADLGTGKNLPELLLNRVPGPYEDWLVWLLSSRFQQGLKDFDEFIDESDEDFHRTGLKIPIFCGPGRKRKPCNPGNPCQRSFCNFAAGRACFSLLP